MFKKSLSAVFAALVAVVVFSACGGGGGGGGGGIDPGYQSWYDVYGNRCDTKPGPGCNFYANGYKIVDTEDPYFSRYYALDYANWSYVDSYGRSSRYTGWAFLSPNGILYDYYGDALNDDTAKGRDHGADVAQQEINIVKTAGEFFAAKYQLEASVGMKVAKIVHDYAQLGKSRARTTADFADFSQRLYGQDLNKVQKVLLEAKAGHREGLEAVIQEAAANWSTTPETMKEILKVWYGKQAQEIL